jgi:hypothetical protein
MKFHPMHVAERDVFILNLASASFAQIEVQKSIINKLKPCADMSPKVEKFALVDNPEHVQSTSEN